MMVKIFFSAELFPVVLKQYSRAAFETCADFCKLGFVTLKVNLVKIVHCEKSEKLLLATQISLAILICVAVSFYSSKIFYCVDF